MTRLPLCLLLLLSLLVACTPTPSQAGLLPAQTPRPTSGPNKQMTVAAVDLQAAIVQATAQAGAIIATQGAAAAATAGTANERAWVISQATLGADRARATETVTARQTATALAAPIVAAAAQSTYTALKEKGARDAEAAAIASARAERRLALVPYTTAAPLVVLGVMMLCIWLVVRALSAGYILRVRAEYLTPRDEYDNAYEPQIPERPQMVLYTGTPGNVSGGSYSDMPCSEAEMSTIAFWVLQWGDGDKSLAVNKYERRGMSGIIRETREWFVRHGYAEQNDNNEVMVNHAGAAFLQAWINHHPALERPQFA